jgi:hypothetical protein
MSSSLLYNVLSAEVSAVTAWCRQSSGINQHVVLFHILSPKFQDSPHGGAKEARH